MGTLAFFFNAIACLKQGFMLSFCEPPELRREEGPRCREGEGRSKKHVKTSAGEVFARIHTRIYLHTRIYIYIYVYIRLCIYIYMYIAETERGMQLYL